MENIRGLEDKGGRVFKTKRFHPVLNFVIMIIDIGLYNFLLKTCIFIYRSASRKSKKITTNKSIAVNTIQIIKHKRI